jgi:hypothetical protein
MKALESFLKNNADKIYVFKVKEAIKYLYFMFHCFIKLQDIITYCVIEGTKQQTLKELGEVYHFKHTDIPELLEEQKTYQKLFKEFNLTQILRAIKKEKSSNKDLNQIIKNAKNIQLLYQRMQIYWGTYGCCQHNLLIKQSCYNLQSLSNLFDFFKKQMIDSKTYNIYLNNQYLLAINNLSGTYIDYNKLEELTENLNTIRINSTVALERYGYLLELKTFPEVITFPVNAKIDLLIHKYHSDLFTIQDMIELGKQFVQLYQKQPDVLNALIEVHLPEIQILLIKDKKTVEDYSNIGKIVYTDCNFNEWFKQITELQISLETIKQSVAKTILEQTIQQFNIVLKDKRIDTIIDDNVKTLYNSHILKSKEELEKLLNLVYLSEYKRYTHFKETLNKTADFTLANYLKFECTSLEYLNGNFDNFLESLSDLKDSWKWNNYEELIIEPSIDLFTVYHINVLWNILKTAEKILATSIKAVYENSFNIDRIGSTFCTAINPPIDKSAKIKYFNNAKANACKSNRWTCRDHSIFTETEDTRAIMNFKMGDSFGIESDLQKTINVVYEIEGLLFRPFDFLKLADGGYILAKDIKEDDQLDSYWLQAVKYNFNKKTRGINWKQAYLKG